MGTAWVEVPQSDDSPVLVGVGERFHEHLDADFGLGVGVDGVGGIGLLAAILFSIYCCCGREDEFRALGVLLHAFEEVQGPDEIVLVVEDGEFGGFWYALFGSEMDDGGDGGVVRELVFEDGEEERQVEHVALVELDSGIDLLLLVFLVFEDGFDSFEDVDVAVGEVVDDDYFEVCGGEELQDGVGADVAQTARDENGGHGELLL